MSFKSLSLLFVCFLTVGCSQNNEPVIEPEPVPEPENPVETPADELPGVEILSIPVSETISLTDEEAEANAALNKFAFVLLNETVENADNIGDATADGNICVSPLSAELCVALMAEGMGDVQGSKVADTLAGASRDVLGSTCNKLVRYLPSKASGASLELANSVWYRDIFKASETFVDKVNDTYYSEVVSVAGDQSLVDLVNKWCKIKTHAMIDAILEREHEGVDVVFAHALYFKADWESAFSEKLTKPAVFTGRDGANEVEMMSTAFGYEYAECDNFKAVRLPFEGEMAMTVILPEEGVAADDVASALSVDIWNSLDFAYKSVALRLPKFEVEYSADFSSVLSGMGIPLRFNLAGMGINRDGNADILQKTAFKINEYGAEGAAVTAGIWSGADIGSKPKYIEMRFDRPFVYVVSSSKTGTVLMAGVINNL